MLRVIYDVGPVVAGLLPGLNIKVNTGGLVAPPLAGSAETMPAKLRAVGDFVLSDPSCDHAALVGAANGSTGAYTELEPGPFGWNAINPNTAAPAVAVTDGMICVS